MKVTATREPVSFNPIKLSLIIESDDQLCAIFSVFNHCMITDLLDEYGVRTDDIREAIKGIVGGKPVYEKIWGELDAIINSKD